MKRLSYLLTLLLMFPMVGEAQTVIASSSIDKTKQITFTGKIVDAQTGEPLPFVQINHIYKYANTDSLIIRNFVSDKAGNIKFQSPRTMNNRIEVVCLGYKVLTRMLNEAGNKLNGSITGIMINQTQPKIYNQFDLGVLKLEPDVEQVDEVVVKARLELFKRVGDTLMVYPRAVKQLEGDDLMDLLKRHPSFYVDDNGTIYVDGKPIERAMLNNKHVFGEDIKTMVHSIMAKEAGLIKVYDEIDETSEILNGKEFARKRKVMNVITFKDFNMFKGGEVYLEAGVYADKDADGERQYMHEAKGKIGQYASNFRISAEGNTKATAFPQKTKDTGAGLNAEVSSPDLLKMVNTKYKFNKNVLEQESRTEQFYFPSTYFESQTANQSYKSIDDKNTHKFDISGKYVIKEKISMMGSYTGSVGNSYNQSQSISNLYRNGEQLSYMQQIRESNSKNDAHEVNLELTKSLKKLGSLQLRVRGEYQKKEGDGIRIDTSNSSEVIKKQVFNIYSNSPYIRINPQLTYSKNFQNLMLGYESAVIYQQTDRSNKAVNQLTGQIDTIATQDMLERNIKFSNKLRFSGQIGDGNLFVTHITYNNYKYKLEEKFPGNVHTDKNFHSLDGYVNFVYDRLSFVFMASDNSFSSQNLSSRLKDSNPMNLSVGNPNLKMGKTYKFSGNLNLNEVLRLKTEYSVITNPVLQTRRYFETNTILPEYNNYEALAGAILTTPVNANSYKSFQVEVASNSRRGKVLLRGYLNYTFENPETDLLGEITRSYTNRAMGSLSLISNFSSSFRLDITNSTSYNHTEIKSKEPLTNSWISNNLVGKTSFNLFYRLLVNADYRYSYNYNSRSKQTINLQSLNASVDYRIFSNRRGVISLKAYNLLNTKSSLTTTNTDIYIQNTYRPENSTLVSVSFQYKFGVEE